MLQTMRDNSKGVVAGILVGLLVIIFALSGAEALFSSRNSDQVALTVNGQDITETEVQRAIEQQKAQMRSRFGDAVPEDFLSSENLREPAIEQLVERTLLIQAAEDANMAVSESQISNVIMSIGAFQNESGQFDPNTYRMVLARSAYTPATYRKELVRDLTVNQLASGISQSNFATAEEAKWLLQLNSQTRDFSYVTLSTDSLMDQVDVSEADIQTYYDANASEFTEPEKVAVEYIELSVDALMEDVEVTEETLRAQFEDNIEDFTPSIERHAAHILLEEPSEEQLAEVQQALNSGADFAELAQQYSDDLGSKDQGGDVGISSGDAFPEAFEEALEALSVGEVSGPVETDAGTHFIKLLSETGGEPASFEEQRDQIAAQIKRARAETRFIELLDRLEDLSYNAESLAAVASELGLSAENTEPFSRDGGAGIASSGQFVRAAFSEEVLEFDNASEVIELAPDRVVVLKKTELQPSYVKPLAEVSDQIRANLSEEKAAQLLAEQGKALEQALASGTDFAEVAEQYGVEVIQLEAIARGDMEQPRAVVEFAFSLPRPEAGPVIDGVARSGEYTVVRLTAVNIPSEEPGEDELKGISQALAGMYGAADFQAFAGYLRETADIER
ncbi:SurA N-terminal domain-containing protein [Gilvimarinus algae]|uniref:Periplasmic chaperone PpiD n=1 Tax=Gilvimarinus algae TaxID=3058037 RepID=A0ABT8TED0_9GAMM|nr:SurA N-terminal domain-containing protein [Gilvimarinus sp. SDUM040014]MDO3382320.1 SurA N-terminal domain-containing protein [Gilvimarinus sp. SDUM040014]